MGIRDRLSRYAAAAEAEKQATASSSNNEVDNAHASTKTPEQQMDNTRLDINTDNQSSHPYALAPPYSVMTSCTSTSTPTSASEEKAALAARYAQEAELSPQHNIYPKPSLSEKSPLQPTKTSRTHFASLSLHMTDRLRMLNFPGDAQQLILSTVKSTWTAGIQDTRDYYGSAEIKLRGNPWRGAGDESIFARELLRKILEALYNAGWVLSLNTDISKKLHDLDTLIFRAQSPAPAPCQWMVVAFSKSDRLRLIAAPREVVDSFTSALGSRIQSHNPYQIPYVYEYKIKGYPWMPTGGEAVAVRQLLMILLGALEENGFSVYASIDQKTGPLSNDSHRSETDTWFCTRVHGHEDRDPQLPIYHG